MDASYTLQTGCPVGCSFCPFQREGARSAEAHAEAIQALVAGDERIQRLFITGGDVLGYPGLRALLKLLAREEGLPRLYLYSPLHSVQPALSLQGFPFVAGVLVPFFSRVKQRTPTTPNPRLLLRAAGLVRQAGLELVPYLFALPESLGELPEMVAATARAFGNDLAFLRIKTLDGDTPEAGRYEALARPLLRAAAVARRLGVDLRFQGDEFPPPCAPPAGAVYARAPGLYGAVMPEADGPRANAALPACADCDLAFRCRWDHPRYVDRHGAVGFAPVRIERLPERHVRDHDPERPEDLFAFRWYLERADVGLGCARPWTSMEVMAIRPRKALPCNEDWFKHVAPYEEEEGSLLVPWNGPYYRRLRQAIAGDTLHEVCQPNCALLQKARHQQEVGERIEVQGESPTFLANHLLHYQELIERRVELRSRPLEFAFGPTYRCNHACIMCHSIQKRALGHDEEMDAAFYRSVTDDLLPTLAELHVSGPGEPLASRPFREFLFQIDGARYPDLRVTLTTNGSLVTPRMVERLLKVPFKGFIISLNAVSAEVHRAVVARDTHAKVMANLEHLAARRRDFAHGAPILQLSFVVLRKNVHELPAFFELVERLGAGLILNPMEPDIFNQEESLLADPEALARAHEIVAELRARYARHATFRQYLDALAANLATQDRERVVKDFETTNPEMQKLLHEREREDKHRVRSTKDLVPDPERPER
jgi:MoaA/NifB/PqqE/SkfB family radical SAM enzyme